MNEIEPFWAGAMLHGRCEDFEALAAVGGSGDLGWESLRAAKVDPERAKRWLQTPAVRTRGELITLLDPRYPARLSSMEERPVALLVEGDVSCFAMHPSVGIVGTRSCTAYGRSLARTLGRTLAAEGALVVSGLARGVDAYAHQGAIEAGRTLAVLGHGLGHMSPASNKRLRGDIVERGGLVVSTWLDAMEPARWTFPRRNRWIAALSDHLIVVEAPIRSGALITATEAGSIGRSIPVWAAPGQVGSSASAGCLQLLSEGARVVVSVEHTVRSIFGERGAFSVPEGQEAWITRLCAGASLDDVARMRGVSTIELVREVTRLELKGLLVRLPGQRYARSGPAREAAAHE